MDATSKKILEESFDQFKFVCLFSLILVHVISFSNLKFYYPLAQSDYFPMLYIFGLYNTLFITIFGVSLRIMIDREVNGGRARFSSGIKYMSFLFGLVILDTAKFAVFFGESAIFDWGFLRTLLFAIFFILAVSHFHIGLLLLPAILLPVYYDPIDSYLRQFETLDPMANMPFLSTVLYNVSVVGVLALFFFWIFFQIRKVEMKKSAQLFVYLLLGGTFLLFCGATVSAEPSLHGRKYGCNWILWAIIGRKSEVSLFPILAWLPSVCWGFLACHFAMWARKLFQPSRGRMELLLHVTAIAFFVAFYKLWSIPHYPPDTAFLWDTTGAQRTSDVGELLKLSFFAMTFCFLVMCNYTWPGFFSRKLSRSYSAASFPIYFIASSWTMLLPMVLPKSMGYWTVFAINLVTSFLLCHASALITHFLMTTKIKLHLKSNAS